MNENAIAQQLIDQLRFYSYGARGMLSPENQIAWARQYGNPRAFQSVQQIAQQGANLAPYATSLMNPSALIGGLGAIGTYGVLQGARQATPQDWQNAMQTARFGIPINQQYTRRR